MITDDRLNNLTQWVQSTLKTEDTIISIVSGDASFRRYFRVHTGGQHYIVMDAPPEKEDCHPFIRISKKLLDLGLNVPEVLAQDLTQGFLLLTDLGDDLYLQQLNTETAERLYGDALDALITIQSANTGDLPAYDHTLLMREMNLFREWLLPQQLGLTQDFPVLDSVFNALAESALAQPVVMVHRDFHSRNLMLLTKHNPGIIDFQDAVAGPITYDLVSLLRDCYIEWPRTQVESWVRDYHALLLESGILRDANEDQFLRWFDWMGVQRHLKASGIFARLNIRDHKPGYLQDIPRTLNYVLDVSNRYQELQPLHDILQQQVWPHLDKLTENGT